MEMVRAIHASQFAYGRAPERTVTGDVDARHFSTSPMRAFLLALALVSSASAQDGALHLREAVAGPKTPKTKGMTLAEDANGLPVWLGATLLTLGPGDVETVSVSNDAFTGMPVIDLALGPEAGEAFAQITASRMEEAVAIMLGDRVLMAPVIQSPIVGGRISLQGVTRDEAEVIVASIRESTGAVDPVQRMRERVDLSSPEGAAVAYVHAIDMADWRTAATILHPDALRALRAGGAEQTVEIAGDRARLVGDPSVSVSIPDVLGRAPSVARYADLPDVDAAALWFAVMSETGASFGGWGAGLEPVGTVNDGGRVHVVLRQSDRTVEGEGFTHTAVVTVRRLGSGLEPSWRALFRTNGTGAY